MGDGGVREKKHWGDAKKSPWQGGSEPIPERPGSPLRDWALEIKKEEKWWDVRLQL
jgi:hypothetical protein